MKHTTLNLSAQEIVFILVFQAMKPDLPSQKTTSGYLPQHRPVSLAGPASRALLGHVIIFS